jgi:hypothetical protein
MTKPESIAPKIPDQLRARCQNAATGSADSEELLELTMQLLAQELIARRLQGQPVSNDLKIVDRLMRYESLKLRRTNARLREQKAKAKSAARSQESPAPAAPVVTTPPPRDRSKPFVLNPCEVGPLPEPEIVPMPS